MRYTSLLGAYIWLKSFLFVLLLVYFLSDPLSSIWTIYQYDSHDFIASLIGSTINRIVVGFILFIVFMIILFMCIVSAQ